MTTETLGVYEVTGRRIYRGHAPGEVFEARIPASVEKRAVDRGDIVVLDRVTPDLPETWELPKGWAE